MLEGDTRKFDDFVRNAVHRHAALAYLVHAGFSFLGSVAVVTTLCVLAIAVFLYFRQARTAALLATTMIGMAVLDITLKLAFPSPRPLAYLDPLQPHIVFRAPRYGFRLLLWSTCCDSRGTCERTPRQMVHLDGAVLLIGMIGYSRFIWECITPRRHRRILRRRGLGRGGRFSQ